MSSVADLFNYPRSHFMEKIDFFLFATNLTEIVSNDDFSYDSIYFGNVHNDNIWKYSNIEELISDIEKHHSPVSSKTFATLGCKQTSFFILHFPQTVIIDVLYSTLPNIECEIPNDEWIGIDHVYFRARQIVMWQYIIIKEEDYPPLPYINDVLCTHALLHATNLKKTVCHSEIHYEFDSIIFAPLIKKKKKYCRQFDNVLDFLEWFATNNDYNDIFNFAVLGKEQREFFKLMNFSKDVKKIVDICIPSEKINRYCCRQKYHIYYHIKRIQAYQKYFKMYNNNRNIYYINNKKKKAKNLERKNLLKFDSFNNNLLSYNSNPIFQKTAHFFHSIKNVKMFLFATELVAKKNTKYDKIYSYRSILFANENFSGELKDISDYADNYFSDTFLSSSSSTTTAAVVVGVLGLEQMSFFKSILPNVSFLDVVDSNSPLLVPLIDLLKLDGLKGIVFEYSNSYSDEEIYFRAKRIEMLQNVLKEDLMTMKKKTSNVIPLDMFKDFAMPGSSTTSQQQQQHLEGEEEEEEEEEFNRNDIMKIKMMLHVNDYRGDTIFDNNSFIFPGHNGMPTLKRKNYQHKAILSSIGQKEYSTLKFNNLFELSKHFDENYSKDYIAVYGKDEFQIFSDYFPNIKFVNVLVDFPIDYICRNVEQAKYHAIRIEYLKMKSLEIYDTYFENKDCFKDLSYRRLPCKFLTGKHFHSSYGLCYPQKVRKFTLQQQKISA